MMYRASQFLVNAVAPAFGMLLALWLIWNVETRFFPVVTDFQITEIKRGPEGFTASGELTKSRGCEFVGLTLYATKPSAPKLLVGQFKKDVFGSDVGTGEQTWGPLTLNFPAQVKDYEHLEIQGVHRCHALWLQTTTYYNMDIKRLPQ